MATSPPPVCVTGAGGFIGSWLVKLLLSRGYAVYATVRDPRMQPQLTGRLTAQLHAHLLLNFCTLLILLSLAGDAKVACLAQLDGAPENLRLFKANMLDYDTVAAAFAGCEGVFHVATPVPEQKMVDPQESACILASGYIYMIRVKPEARS